MLTNQNENFVTNRPNRPLLAIFAHPLEKVKLGIFSYLSWLAQSILLMWIRPVLSQPLYESLNFFKALIHSRD